MMMQRSDKEHNPYQETKLRNINEWPHHNPISVCQLMVELPQTSSTTMDAV